MALVDHFARAVASAETLKKVAAASSRIRSRTSNNGMKIGIVGTGNMAQALGLRWAWASHEVLFGSGDVKKAKAVAARHRRRSCLLRF